MVLINISEYYIDEVRQTNLNIEIYRDGSICSKHQDNVFLEEILKKFRIGQVKKGVLTCMTR